MTLQGRSKLMKTMRRRADRLLQVVAEYAVENVISKTPVQSGTLAANWVIGIEHIDRSVDLDLSRSSIPEARRKAVALLRRARAGDKVFITNSVPYALTVEMGDGNFHPRRAMVALTAAQLRAALPDLARRVRREVR